MQASALLAAASLFSTVVVDEAPGATPLTTVRLGSGFAKPLWVGSPPGDKTRLFVVEQDTARIRILRNGGILPTPFLDIKSKVYTSGNEQGLLGFAFHPDYANNGKFYVNYTKSGSNNGATIVEQYTVSAGNPNVADPNSGQVILGPIAQPYSNHNGGCIAFGPNDGYLYVGMGDGGSGGDPMCRAQNLSVQLGKILRIDVDNGGTAPATNPFVGNPNADPLIWAYGVRNPWRFSFDSMNGDMYVADVGQNAWEEVNWVSGKSVGGDNYGWKMMEGTHCFGTSSCGPVPPCNDASLIMPLKDYNHSTGCSVTGGYAYRGCAIPDLEGTYFYADYCSARIWSLQVVGGKLTNHQERTSELAPGGGLSISGITSFGEDACGEILIVDQGGEIFKIIPAAPAPGVDLGFGLPGGSGEIPELSVCGLLDSGNSADLDLSKARPVAACLLFVSLNQNPVPALGGTLIPDLATNYFALPFVTDSDGKVHLDAQGGNGVLDVYTQYLIDDPGAAAGVAFSNALKLTLQP